jgi:Na+/H+ antiporter NhaD/arsenite permease-like protein
MLQFPPPCFPMNTIIVLTFCIGYCLIACEHFIKIRKTATALLTGVFCWAIYMAGAPSKETVYHELIESVGGFSGIIFFLMGAMAIVELISSHDGFAVITGSIHTRSKRKLLWIISLVAFFLSSVLDNLTTTIVMVSLMSKILSERSDRMVFAGMIVIAANAGGAWTPIGDVTTTMLWIGGNISSTAILLKMFLPSMLCLIVPLIICTFTMRGPVPVFENSAGSDRGRVRPLKRNVVFFSGVGVLLFVPVFKAISHLPPFMGILLGVGVLWVIIEVMNVSETEEAKKEFSVANALRNIDLESVLFFLGILVCISALEASGVLMRFAAIVDAHVRSRDLVVFLTGILSAVVDNVPLVAAFMGMYDLSAFPMDHPFWLFLAYCVGTGGSLLVIGSAAGVVAMGLAKLEFFWYLRKISLLAFAGYLAGALCYIGLELLWK